jgi:hypothetical protein
LLTLIDGLFPFSDRNFHAPCPFFDFRHVLSPERNLAHEPTPGSDKNRFFHEPPLRFQKGVEKYSLPTEVQIASS